MIAPGTRYTVWELIFKIYRKGAFFKNYTSTKYFLISNYQKASFLKISKYLVEGLKKYLTLKKQFIQL